MSLILMTILFFLNENISQVIFPGKRKKILTKKLYGKLKIFVLIADVLLMAVLGLRFLLSRIEPLLIYLVVNLDELSSAEGVRAIIDSIQSYLTFEITPVDISFVLVVFLAYFGGAVAPGVLCAFSPAVESPQSSPHRSNGQSGIVSYPEIFKRGKLFLKLCHLLN